jgi:hypothetical protein
MINQVLHKLQIDEFVSIRRGDNCWVKTEADAEGGITVPPGAVWSAANGCWCFYEENHDENEECKLCQAGHCVQEINVFPRQNKVLVIHEPMVVKVETETMPLLS